MTTKRHLEAYIFDDEILTALCAQQGQAGKAADLLVEKSKDIAASVANGHPQDDIKSAAGRITVSCQRLLQLKNSGRTNRAFMRDTLVPLITPDTKVYQELKAVIFGE